MMNLRNYVDGLETYLNSKGLESLWVNGGVKIKQYRDYPLYCLKYSSWADKESPLVRACRGTVVSHGDKGFRVESLPFIRFFNLGEFSTTQEFDWNSYEAYEKYDGSLVTLFNYQGKWLLSTSSTVEGLIHDHEVSKLFWGIWDSMAYNKEDLDPSQIYIWELCSRINKVVVTYQEDMLVLLAVRDKSSLLELNLESFREKFKVAQSFKFNSEGELLEFVNSRKGDKSEGLIIKDQHGNRLKVKSKEYVKFHNLLNNNRPNLGQIWALGELDEFLTYFPEYFESADQMLNQIKEKSMKVEKFLSENRGLDQKQFAFKVFEEMPDLSSALFSIRSGKSANLEYWLRNRKTFTI